jgi:HEAT repeat protein
MMKYVYGASSPRLRVRRQRSAPFMPGMYVPRELMHLGPHTGSGPVRLRHGVPVEASVAVVPASLLAEKALHVDAINALARAAPTSTGQLVDALCDPRVDFHARRRIPRVLSRVPTIASAEGLVRAIEDERFEVRYECGRALLEIRAANPEIAITLERIVAIVTREVGRDEKVWDVELDADDEEEDAAAPSLFDRLRRDRLDSNVEHVFNVLALHLDPESLRTAFKALHEEDDALRGTALEYLETVLPDEVRDLVWPFLGEARPMRAARPAKEILADLQQPSHGRAALSAPQK